MVTRCPGALVTRCRGAVVSQRRCVLCQILQTGQEIMELDTSGFATQGPTIFAGNIGDGRYIVQVSPLGVRLLEGGEEAARTHKPIHPTAPQPHNPTAPYTP